MKKLQLNPHPCDTCPYRKDTPSGIWHAKEYRKLPKWDNPLAFAGVFHCHNQTESRQTVCRGWMEVHHDNLQVRLTIATRIEFNEHNKNPTTVPLHESGEAAMKTGMKRIKNPSLKAKVKVQKLLTPPAFARSMAEWSGADYPYSLVLHEKDRQWGLFNEEGQPTTLHPVDLMIDWLWTEYQNTKRKPHEKNDPTRVVGRSR